MTGQKYRWNRGLNADGSGLIPSKPGELPSTVQRAKNLPTIQDVQERANTKTASIPARNQTPRAKSIRSRLLSRIIPD